jgi:hypothetical protein
VYSCRSRGASQPAPGPVAGRAAARPAPRAGHGDRVAVVAWVGFVVWLVFTVLGAPVAAAQAPLSASARFALPGPPSSLSVDGAVAPPEAVVGLPGAVAAVALGDDGGLGFAWRADLPPKTVPAVAFVVDNQGDGERLFVLDRTGRQVDVLAGDPGHHFGLVSVLPAGVEPVDMGLVDLNGDRLSDLVVVDAGSDA